MGFVGYRAAHVLDRAGRARPLLPCARRRCAALPVLGDRRPCTAGAILPPAQAGQPM